MSQLQQPNNAQLKNEESQAKLSQRPANPAVAKPALDKLTAKFNFIQISKFVKCELQKKTSLIELRLTFSKILELDLAGRNLVFELQQGPNQPTRQLNEITPLGQQGMDGISYDINVSLQDYGA